MTINSGVRCSSLTLTRADGASSHHVNYGSDPIRHAYLRVEPHLDDVDSDKIDHVDLCITLPPADDATLTWVCHHGWSGAFPLPDGAGHRVGDAPAVSFHADTALPAGGTVIIDAMRFGSEWELHSSPSEGEQYVLRAHIESEMHLSIDDETAATGDSR